MAAILVVDDEPDLRFLLRIFLTSFAHSVTEAPDGGQALELMRSSRPDLLMTDLMMPVMDGGELIRCVRADPALDGLPIIVVSATPTPDVRADAFLQKPFAPQAIQDAIVRLLGGG